MKFNIVKFKPKQLLQLKPKAQKGLECLNCGQPLRGSDNFCSYCGQKNTVKKLSFGIFLSNMFSGFFNYDSRFWRTFIPLLTKPGKVSKEFIKGKRVHFVNPFQMYLNVSIVFFLIMGISDRFNDKSSFEGMVKFSGDLDSLKVEMEQNPDSLVANVKENIVNVIPNDSSKAEIVTELDDVMEMMNLQAKDTLNKKPYQYHNIGDSIQRVSVFNRIKDFDHFYKNHKEMGTLAALDSLNYEPNFWNKFYYQQIRIGYQNIDQFVKDKGESFYKKLTSHVSIALFVFLPIFTLFLRFLYIRRKFTYMEHLVFVFHTQTVFFLMLIIFYLLNFFVELQSFAWVFVIMFLIYLYKALRLFYEQRRIKTFIKFILLNSYYMFLSLIGLAIVSIISFMVK